jgi:redox-sensitive bicupin YhaK (pirin superfamily)
MLYNEKTSPYFADQGKFRILFHMPGELLSSHGDHGYGALATVAESYMDPDTWVQLHPHANEEIISWVPDGVMRHKDPKTGDLITDSSHLMIMNSGKGFWHEERTLSTDPPLRMLQIFVRPYALDLKPGIQHGLMPAWHNNEWRKVFGQEGSGEGFYVRNDIEMYDIRMKKGDINSFPSKVGYATYFFVFEGMITTKDTVFEIRKTGILTGEEDVLFTADQDSILVAFVINPEAEITTQGTIGR